MGCKLNKSGRLDIMEIVKLSTTIINAITPYAMKVLNYATCINFINLIKFH